MPPFSTLIIQRKQNLSERYRNSYRIKPNVFHLDVAVMSDTVMNFALVKSFCTFYSCFLMFYLFYFL